MLGDPRTPLPLSFPLALLFPLTIAHQGVARSQRIATRRRGWDGTSLRAQGGFGGCRRGGWVVAIWLHRGSDSATEREWCGVATTGGPDVGGKSLQARVSLSLYTDR